MKTTIAYVLAITALTYALTVDTSTVHFDPKIVQVTDDHQDPNGHQLLLGTLTELKFKSFMKNYEKEYQTTEEYVHRLGVFAANLGRAAAHQAVDPTARHGVTQFSDLEPEEFERLFTGVLRGGGGVGNTVAVHGEAMETEGLPESFDWREKGAVTDIKMQVNYIN